MSREEWTLTKEHKNFNVHIYRRGIKFLLISLLISTSFIAFIFYIYLNIPERDYYATNGVTPPVKLTAMMTPNMSSNALLEPDPPTDNVQLVIPQ
ncbi:type IVB secretion system protein IcmM/DotJ [Legionella waltersii]|uniref:Component of the Dot/Icm secretion system, predicted inner membrane protein n=1 Tax=Legionella waltersii TaxID=66969 RepID=A0A0W1A2M5_9GAMM|nr:type IVB secretion system protein IcmM/DotJ [Legionella waltersii]KTD75544.1 Component of the Dot/Icm secretion system, predicted inner membrane protein [Legionella waltersii]SNU98603.1 Component of the Dot/Icm secretion system. inner membrane protein [Legionella waltersii]